MLETTQTINFFIPVMLTVFVAVGFASIFNRSIYERALRSKQIPMLRNHCPKSQKHVTAFTVMSSPVVTVEGLVSVEYLQEILKHQYSTFPVLNSAGNMVGLIPKNFIITLIKNHAFYDESQLNEQQKAKLPRMYRALSSADELMRELNLIRGGPDE
jgi:predicted transcriptional regulator